MKFKQKLTLMGLLLSSSVGAQDLTIVNDLASYAGTDATVYNKADGNVYKYNSLGQYELYGVYEVVDFAAPQVTEVEYITNADNSDLWISDYRPKANTRVFATVQIASTANGRRGVFGTREHKSKDNDNDKEWPHAFYFETVRDNTLRAKLNEDYEADFTINDGSAFVGVKSVFDLNGMTGQSNVYVDGATIATHTWTRWPDDYDYWYFLSFFDVRQNNDALKNAQPAGMKLYGAKIYEGSTLVRELVPVVTGSGRGGLKDRITGTVYTNGDGTISASGSYSVTAAGKGVSTYEGKLVYNTADGGMYRWDGSEWVHQGTGLQEINDTKYFKFYDSSASSWNWFYPDKKFDNTFAGFTTDVSATYGNRANHNDKYVGAKGYEPLQYVVSCFEEEADYRLSFDFTTDGFASHDGNVKYMPLYLRSGSYSKSVGSWGHKNDLSDAADVWTHVQVPFNKQSEWHIGRNFTASRADATLIIQFGTVTDNKEYQFWFDNIYIHKLLYPATYPALSYTSDIEALVSEADGWTEDMTTNALWTALHAARANADTYKYDTYLSKQKEVHDALQTALNSVKAAGDVTILRQTVSLASSEGVDVTDAEAFLVSGTTSVVPVLNALRVRRQINAKGHHAAFTGATPAIGETYYLYNVGQGLFLCPSLTDAHELALGFAGDPLTLEQNDDGYQLRGTMRAGKYVGHQWKTQGFFDGTGSDAATRWYFFAVEGKANVYNISKANNTNKGNLLGYVPEATPTYGIGEADNSQDWGMRVRHNLTGVDDARNQWMFVTKAERDALLATASEDNPVDATYYIIDPAFDHNHALQSAWQSSATLDISGDVISKNPADANLVIADAGVSVSQAIAGLTPGIYGVSVQSVYMHPSDFSATGAELFATNGNGETWSQAIAARNAALDQVPGMGVRKEEGWMPAANRYISKSENDGAGGAAYYFHYGKYWNEVKDVIVGSDGKLTIGVKKNTTTSGDVFVSDNFRLTYYGPLTKVITLTNGYATFSADQPFSVTTEGVSAYKATAQNAGNIHLEAISDIPAGSGVVLYGEGKSSVTLKAVSASTADVSDNMLKPNLTAYALPAEAGGYKNYILGLDPDDSSSCVFRPSTGNGMLAAGRAYLALPSTAVSSEAKYYISFGDDDATAVRGIDAQGQNERRAIYNLAGQQMKSSQSADSRLPRGIYIVNGKKLLR